MRPFEPTAISTPTITAYRSYLQTVLKLRPATINRHLVSLKRYFGWAVDAGVLHPAWSNLFQARRSRHAT